jgi:hypothetical protein
MGAHAQWHEAAQLVALRWEVFLEAGGEARGPAFASYLAALEAGGRRGGDGRTHPTHCRVDRTSSPRVARAALTSNYPHHSQGASTCHASSWPAIALASVFLVVASVAFSTSTTASLAIGIANLVMSTGVAYEYRRRRMHDPAGHDDRAMAAASSQHTPHAT